MIPLLYLSPPLWATNQSKFSNISKMFYWCSFNKNRFNLEKLKLFDLLLAGWTSSGCRINFARNGQLLKRWVVLRLAGQRSRIMCRRASRWFGLQISAVVRWQKVKLIAAQKGLRIETIQTKWKSIFHRIILRDGDDLTKTSTFADAASGR